MNTNKKIDSLKIYTIKVTILLEKSLWIALFERNDNEGFAVARKIFGSEPSDAELYDFILTHFDQLRFSEPHDFKLVIKRKNPKRVQREVRHEMKKAKASPTKESYAQEVLRMELEKNKKTRKAISKSEKEQRLNEKFLMKQAKKKQKHRGH